MKSRFNDWLDASAPAWGRMLEAYTDAARDAREPAARLAVLDELMNAAVAARKRFVDAASTAMPTAWRSNAELRDIYIGELDAGADKMAATPAAKICLRSRTHPSMRARSTIGAPRWPPPGRRTSRRRARRSTGRRWPPGWRRQSWEAARSPDR
jgi:hypothetical protein